MTEKHELLQIHHGMNENYFFDIKYRAKQNLPQNLKEIAFIYLNKSTILFNGNIRHNGILHKIYNYVIRTLRTNIPIFSKIGSLILIIYKYATPTKIC